MTKKLLTTLFLLLIAFVWTSALAQNARDAYNGIYQGQLIPQGKNVAIGYDGPLDVLWDNGPMVTHPGGGYNGADASALQTSLGMTVYGFGHAISTGYSVADDFTLSADCSIEELHFFAYQTGSGITPTINAYHVEIYDGDPSSGGTIVWGDWTTNVFTSATFTNDYRVLDTDLLNNQRPIMESVVMVSPALDLPAGTYWIRWQAGGTLSSGPWQPPVTVLGSTGTGNAYQETGGVWTPIVDVGPQDMPFLVLGTCGGSVNFTDDFDSYISGQQLACQATPDWTTWSLLPCDPTEDPYVSSNYAYSGANSTVIVQNNDLVHVYDPTAALTSGTWYTSVLVYIPTGASGYFNELATFTGGTYNWGLECYFNAGGAGSLNAGGTGAASFTWQEDTWQQAVVVVDVDNDVAEFWFGDSDPLTMIYSWQWTLGSNGVAIPLSIDGNDIFGAAATDEMYIDNYYFGDAMPPIIPVELTSFTGICNNGVVELNWKTATEVNNQGFEIQRKAETNEYMTIGFVQGFGTTTEPRNYSYTDNTVETGSYTYRLKQVDFDGTFAYSPEVEVDVTAPLTFNLEQNYPNPFNPSTNIRYSVPEAGNITLAVYNVVGEEVAVLANGYTEAGSFNVTFDASNLPSGVYLYKLQSANSVQTKKMLLLK